MGTNQARSMLVGDALSCGRRFARARKRGTLCGWGRL